MTLNPSMLTGSQKEVVLKKAVGLTVKYMRIQAVTKEYLDGLLSDEEFAQQIVVEVVT